MAVCSAVKRAVPLLAAALVAAGVTVARPGAETGACAQDAVVPRAECGASAPQTLEACQAVTQSLRAVSARPRGRGLRIAFTRRVNRPVRVDVFQVSAGRRVLGQRRVARFTRTSAPFSWDGRRGSDGLYFVRFSVRDERGRADEQRIALVRRGGRFRLRPAFYRRTSCATLTSFKLERPAFGGARNRALGIAFRLAREGRVTVEILRGGRRVRRFGPTTRRAGITHRLRLPAERLRRGTYRVRLRYTGDQGSLTASLSAQRL
jgi:hypothetical protein